MSEKRYLDVRELSEYLGISKWMIYKYIEQRDIPFIPFGRIIRFDRMAVEKWAEKRMVRAGAGMRLPRRRDVDPARDGGQMEWAPLVIDGDASN